MSQAKTSDNHVLPWWTYILPFLICHMGTQLSLHFMFAPGVAVLYLPIPLAMVMIQWWGPRVLIGVYVNALLCAGFWGLPRAALWPVYALPETVAVLSSWIFFTKFGKGRCWLPEPRDAILFIVLAIIPAACFDGFQVTGQLVLLGDIATHDFWKNAWGEWVGTMLSGFSVAMPLLCFLTPWLERKGWTLTTGASLLRLLPQGQHKTIVFIEIGVILGIPLFLSFLLSVGEYWFVYALIGLWVAQRFGLGGSVLSNTWIVCLTLIVPAIAHVNGAVWAPDTQLLSLHIGLGVICALSIISGSNISALLNEKNLLLLQIKHRERVENELRQSRNMLSQVLNTIPQSVFWKDKESKYLGCNLPFARAVGLESTDPIVGKTDFDLPWPKEEAETYRTDDQLVMDNNHPKLHIVEPLQQSNGIRLWIDTSKMPLLDGNGNVYGVLGIYEDITERRNIEQILVESRDRYHALFEQAGDGIFMLNTNGEIISVNETFTRMHGYSLAEMKNVHLDILDVDRNVKLPERMCRIMAGETLSFEVEHFHKDGHTFPLLVTANLITVGSKKFVIAIHRDLTERKKAEEALRESEEKYRLQFLNMNSYNSLYEVVTDKEGKPYDFRFIMVNTAYENYVGKKGSELIGKTLLEVYPKTEQYWIDKMVEVSLTGVPSHFENFSREMNTYTEISLYVPQKGQLATTTVNIDDRKKMEEELAKVQKLDALGLLAGGIAHDFNNLMGGIFGYIDMANEASKDTKVTHYLTKAMNTIDRARGLTLQLLTFAKGGTPIKKIEPLFPFVMETGQFALSGSNVSSSFDVPEDLWLCNFDKNQIGQVIDNIVINAKQAMSGGGSIRLSARNIAITEKEHPSLTSGDYVKISIIDSGIGIPKEILPRIFDPFYTTKTTGHGLGLATCYSIIKRHGGCIEVESEPGKGSTFHVFLPASKDFASSSLENSATTHKGIGFFIVMDDEVVMRETIGSMLESLGYNVVFKENGNDAIAFAAEEFQAKRKIAGMIFDLTVPGGMGGEEAILEIRKYDLETPAFVTSGYAEDPVMANPNEHGFMASICKPFRKSELSEMLNKYMQTKK